VPAGEERADGELRVLHLLPGVRGGREVRQVALSCLLHEMPGDRAGGFFQGHCGEVCGQAGRGVS